MYLTNVFSCAVLCAHYYVLDTFGFVECGSSRVCACVSSKMIRDIIAINKTLDCIIIFFKYN